jgi:hypothetical protein
MPRWAPTKTTDLAKLESPNAVNTPYRTSFLLRFYVRAVLADDAIFSSHASRRGRKDSREGFMDIRRSPTLNDAKFGRTWAAQRGDVHSNSVGAVRRIARSAFSRMFSLYPH